MSRPTHEEACVIITNAEYYLGYLMFVDGSVIAVP